MPASMFVAALALGASFFSVLVYHVAVVGPRLRALAKRLDGTFNAGGTAVLSEPALLKVIGDRITELERVSRKDVARIGFVRYNSFSDVGSDLSYALALLNSDGDGVVLTSIYSREETRSFGKRVRKFQGDQDVSKEERDAIALARTGVGA